MRILILDDDQDDLQLTANLLKDRIPGVVTQQESGKVALLDLLAEIESKGGVLPDLILLELHMPGFNAHEVIMKLKGNATTKSISVAFFSRSKNPKNYLFASRLNTPLFLKGVRWSDQLQAVQNLMNWYNHTTAANATYTSIF